MDMTGSDHFCEVFFEDVRVPAENLVGELNGTFRQVMRQMEHERGGIDRLVSNRRLYVDMLPLADTSDPLVRQEIAAIETGYRIGRLLVLREVLGQGRQAVLRATKTFCTELEQRIAQFCGRVLGPGAARRAGPGHRVSRNVCYAPAYTIMGGTTQILRNILGERTLGLPREPRPLRRHSRRTGGSGSRSTGATRQPGRRPPPRPPGATITGLSSSPSSSGTPSTSAPTWQQQASRAAQAAGSSSGEPASRRRSGRRRGR